MSTISVSLPSDGETIDASDYNTPINTIVNDHNGNIDNSNIAAAAAIAGTKLADGGITFAKLLTTIFSGQVSTQVNAGSAGGNMYWINLGGIKILWGLGAQLAVGTGGGTFNFTLPTFFTTVQSYQVTGTTPGTSANQYALINTASTSQIQVYLRSDTNGSTVYPSILVIGT